MAWCSMHACMLHWAIIRLVADTLQPTAQWSASWLPDAGQEDRGPDGHPPRNSERFGLRRRRQQGDDKD